MAHRFTIGVEEEFQIIDPGDLRFALACHAAGHR